MDTQLTSLCIHRISCDVLTYRNEYIHVFSMLVKHALHMSAKLLFKVVGPPLNFFLLFDKCFALRQFTGCRLMLQTTNNMF